MTDRGTDTTDGDATAPADAAGAAPGPGAAPATPEAAPTSGGDAPAEGEERSDPQLLVLVVVLWLVAGLILAYKWPRMRVDWHLGNLRQGLNQGQIDEEARQALVALAREDPEGLLGALREELVGPLASQDPLLRAAVVRVLQGVEAPAAVDLLFLGSSDPHPVVRGNAYDALSARIGDDAERRVHLVELLAQVLGRPGEPDPVARLLAVRGAARLADAEAKALAVPLLVTFRDARGGEDDPPRAELLLTLRTEAAQLLARAAAALGAGAPPLDPAGDHGARLGQVRAFEAWLRAVPVELPPGQSLDEVLAEEQAAAAQRAASPAPPGEGSTPQGPPAPDQQKEER